MHRIRPESACIGLKLLRQSVRVECLFRLTFFARNHRILACSFVPNVQLDRRLLLQLARSRGLLNGSLFK